MAMHRKFGLQAVKTRRVRKVRPSKWINYVYAEFPTTDEDFQASSSDEGSTTSSSGSDDSDAGSAGSDSPVKKKSAKKARLSVSPSPKKAKKSKKARKRYGNATEEIQDGKWGR
jgi:hypothetical protein